MMNGMFRRRVLPIEMSVGMSVVGLKADFEADLLNILSPDVRGFSEEVCGDPVHWGRLYDLYKAYEGLYGNFCKDVRDFVKSSEFATKTALSAEKNPGAFAERAFCLLKLSRDVYGKVSEYMSSVYDLDKENAFKDVDVLLSAECRYAFARRLLGLSGFIIRNYARKFELSAFVDTKDRKPDEKVLAEILKPFAKEDAYKELWSNDNNSQLIQCLHVLSKVFDEFSRSNNESLKGIKEAFGDSLFSRFGVPIPGDEITYRRYVLKHVETLSAALLDLSNNVSGRVERMLSIKDKLSPELKKAALSFFRKEKDVRELLKAAESFRIKEKEVRKTEQKVFEKARAELEKLEGEIVAAKKALKTNKDELCKARENGVDVSALEDKIRRLKETVETLKG